MWPCRPDGPGQGSSRVCFWTQERLFAYLEDDLEERERLAVQAHLARCVVCRREWRLCRSAHHALERAGQLPVSPGDLRAGFYEKLARSCPQAFPQGFPRALRSGRPSGWVAVLACAGVLLVAVLWRFLPARLIRGSAFAGGGPQVPATALQGALPGNGSVRLPGSGGSVVRGQLVAAGPVARPVRHMVRGVPQKRVDFSGVRSSRVATAGGGGKRRFAGGVGSRPLIAGVARSSEVGARRSVLSTSSMVFSMEEREGRVVDDAVVIASAPGAGEVLVVVQDEERGFQSSARYAVHTVEDAEGTWIMIEAQEMVDGRERDVDVR